MKGIPTMVKRIYIAPLPTGIDTSPVIEALNKQLGELPVLSVFDHSAGMPAPEDWVGKHADLASQHLLNEIGLEKDFIFDGRISPSKLALPNGKMHALIAALVQAPVVLVLDGSDRTKEEIITQAHVAAQVMEEFGCAPAATVVLNTTVELELKQHIPVLTVTGTDLSDADLSALVNLVDNPPQLPVPPATFQARLVAQAKTSRRTVVLPESEDDRILLAASELLKLDACDLILLGKEAEVASAENRLEINLNGLKVVDPQTPELVEKYAEKLAELRAKKGVTVEKARELLQDSAYFGTMMIVCGDADGMVSGAAHTTANTIRPALQLIKTKPGISTVSGAFIMLYADHQELFADCAVTIDPTEEQLADIAAVSAQTAQQFGIDPKVALISYSTGDSGSGPTVDKVRAATELAQQNHPELAIDGPLQFDAANDPAVAEKKRPGSKVAGQANVYVFCNLDVGNCTYKAVQRTAGAVAVGPVLQGLNAPVNDLSRGALVEDIVNTVIITAVQAQ